MAYVGSLDLAVSGSALVVNVRPQSPMVLTPAGFQAVNTVDQKILIVNEEEKKSYVFDFIRNMEPLDKVLIFVGKKLV